MTKTDIGIYRGLKEKFDPEVHIGFFITTDTGELLVGDQSLGQTISGWEINDGVLTLQLNTGKDIKVTFPEATETAKGLLSAADKAMLVTLKDDLDAKVDKLVGKSLIADSEIEKLAGLPNSTELTNSIATAKASGDNAQSNLNAHKLNISNPHEVTKAQVGLGNVTNDAQVKRSEMGVAGGVATLDEDGKVPSSQLPSYVDDIIDVYATYEKSTTGVLSNIVLYSDAGKTKLVTGEAGKIYQNVEEGEPGYQFRWTGSVFSQTGASSLIIGEVAGTAFDGARGKTVESSLQSHKNDKNNPHEVTKTQIGLGNVDNTSDANKPVSTAQAAAIAAAVEALDATVTSTDGTNVQVKVTETNGKVTAVNITKDDTAKKADLTTHTGNTIIHVPDDGAEGQFLKWVGNAPAWANESLDTSVTESLYGYGIEWNPNVKDPRVTRIGNMAFHKSLPIQSQMKGCVAKKVGDNWQVQYYLKEDDWTKKEDGTASRLDGYDGEVMVEVPRFYYKSWDKPNIKRVMISQTKIDSDWIESPKMLVGAYRSTVLNTVPTGMGYLSSLPVNSAISVKNTAAYCRGGNNSSANDSYLATDVFKTQLGKPRTNISRSTMRTYSRNASKEMLNYNQYKAVFYWLYVIEYANFNSQDTFNSALTSEGYKQGGLGAGVTTVSSEWWSAYNGYYPLIPCGYCDNIGNGTGVKAATVPAVNINSAQTTSLSRYSTGTYIETVDNIPVTKNRWEMTKGATVTITKVNQANTPGIYCGRSTQSGSTVYTVQGLTSGQSITFYTNGAVVATASTNGDITVNWGNSNSERHIRATFTGACNITISIKSASTVSYSVNGYTFQVPRWRGFDNPFGDIWTNLDGVIIRGNAPDYATATVYATNDVSKYGDATSNLESMEAVGTEIKQDGYIKTFNLGSTAEIVPNAIGGSTTTHKCDYHYQGSKDASLRTLLVGGGAYHGAPAGLGCFYSDYGVSHSSTHVGFRSVSLVS